ncbi:MAG: phosphoribosyl-AMP cyclohydrolase [Zoogloea sp.]|uniref:phosphoribosyl-AMP cyclohydrolase n=1 Tax=Zoogloea sp. TaxID=49181 RepID=UPI003F3F76AD
MFRLLEHAPAGYTRPLAEVLDALTFDAQGLLPVIAQQFNTGQVLMLAWMNRTALEETLHSGQACYWSRSRQTLWRKGATSGCIQRVREVRLDCDGDALLLQVDQQGPACHTGRPACFYHQLDQTGLRVCVSPPTPATDLPEISGC